MRFNRLEALVGQKSVKNLNQKRIMIVGLGGVGSFAAEAIARSGIGEIFLVDHDVVDITNINRQLIALESTLGKPKVEVMKDRIRDINPKCIVHTFQLFFNEQSSSKIFSTNPDFIIDAIDTIPSKILLISHAIKQAIPIISSMGFAKKMHPEQIELTTLKKTEICPLAKTLRYQLRQAGYTLDIPVVYSKELPIESMNQDIKLGSSSTVPPVAGLMMASYVINEIIKEET
jgi:tRNA A37 threonylcarbamoyladenosine dehydratase